ncbi:unnamed protein product [Linum trigynum]|uniref:Uncharacterized protein n=1 Tax=Linum trigynum TaxID=586398 RepID=A0AAV2E6B7_9ROSI
MGDQLTLDFQNPSSTREFRETKEKDHSSELTTVLAIKIKSALARDWTPWLGIGATLVLQRIKLACSLDDARDDSSYRPPYVFLR